MVLNCRYNVLYFHCPTVAAMTSLQCLYGGGEHKPLSDCNEILHRDRGVFFNIQGAFDNTPLVSVQLALGDRNSQCIPGSPTVDFGPTEPKVKVKVKVRGTQYHHPRQV